MQPTEHRPAVRVVCLDAAGRVLLLRWCDPAGGAVLWEPPGGGVEPGETPLAAARRELREETGLDPARVQDRPVVVVDRDVWWGGRHYRGPEPFYLARFAGDRPRPTRTGLLAHERPHLLGHSWVARSELGSLAGRLEPPGLAAVVAELVSSGVRTSRGRAG